MGRRQCLRLCRALIALAKASPGKLNFADVGVGSTQNFAGELMRQMAGIDVKHIPYSNTPGVVTGLLSGDVDFLLKCVARDLSSFQAFVTETLTAEKNVASVKSTLVIHASKNEAGVPLELKS